MTGVKRDSSLELFPYICEWREVRRVGVWVREVRYIIQYNYNILIIMLQLLLLLLLLSSGGGGWIQPASQEGSQFYHFL